MYVTGLSDQLLRCVHEFSYDISWLLGYCLCCYNAIIIQIHDSVAKIIHWALSRLFGLTFYQNHVPWSVSHQSVSENSHIKLLWGFNVYTDHVLSVQCLDIVVVNKEIASVQIIDVAVPADCNVTSRRLKSGKYRNLSIELSLWKMKCEITPIVVGCLGCVTHVLKSNLKKLSVFD